MTTTTPAGAIARRPRDRKDQIAQHASELFATRGFHAVRMDDIAAATGITARALYRHYANKQALLSHVVDADQQRLLGALEELANGRRAASHSREDGLRTVASAALSSHRLSLLWQREARHLEEEDYARVHATARRIANAFGTTVLGPLRPDLGPSATAIRSWTALSMLTSPGHHDLPLARGALAEVLLEATRQVILAPAVEASAAGTTAAPHRTDRAPSSRREQLIGCAAAAFRRNGFAGVGIDEIGAGAGVVGPAIYRYFDNKADLLVAATCRFLEWAALENSRALRAADRAEDVVGAVVRGYLRLALEATDLLAVTVTEGLHLPDGVLERVERMRSDDVAEWARWLVIARPGLSDPVAHVLVSAARTLIDDLVRIPHFRQEPRFEAELLSAALATLHSTVAAAGR